MKLIDISRQSPRPQSEKYYGISPYAYCGGNPVSIIDEEGQDLVLIGLNKSSVTFKTDLVDKSFDAGKIGIDWGGELTFEGDELLSAALDIAGVVDPRGVADLANAGLQLQNGEFPGAAISAIGVIPYAGDLAKAAKIGKDLNVIGDAIRTSSNGLHCPYIRKWVREEVEAKTARDQSGRFIDKNKKEYRKLKAEAESNGMTQIQ